jgi:thiol-disulfide isomerase/thioredoxin
MGRLRAPIYFGVGAAVFIAATLGRFQSIELFPWIFGFAWAVAGLVRVALKWRVTTRAQIVLTVAGCVLAILSPVGQIAYFRVSQGLQQRDALVAFAATGTPPLEFAHVVNNRSGAWRNETGYSGVTLLNFWATWCAPCMRELPLLEAFTKSHDPSVARVVGFTKFYDAHDDNTRREELSRIEQVLSEHGVSYPTLVAIGDATHDKYRVQGLPTTVLIGRDGKIAGYGIGLRGTKQLLTLAERLSAEHVRR